MAFIIDYSNGLPLPASAIHPKLTAADSPKPFPASAIPCLTQIHPSLEAEEVRSKEIDRIARMLCAQIEGAEYCDCEVSMWGIAAQRDGQVDAAFL